MGSCPVSVEYVHVMQFVFHNRFASEFNISFVLVFSANNTAIINNSVYCKSSLVN